MFVLRHVNKLKAIKKIQFNGKRFALVWQNCVVLKRTVFKSSVKKTMNKVMMSKECLGIRKLLEEWMKEFGHQFGIMKYVQMRKLM